jgi:hypothetical protein
MSLFSKSSPVELLGSAVEAIAELPAEDRKNTASRVVALLRMMDAHNVSSAKARSALVTGIQFRLRLQALAYLQDQPSYRAWSITSGTPGMHYVHGDLVAAAATAPLVMAGRVASFEPSRFSTLCSKFPKRGAADERARPLPSPACRSRFSDPSATHGAFARARGSGTREG